MLETLSTFFRYSTSRRESVVTFQDELLNTQNYMKIQQYRFDNRFSLEIQTGNPSAGSCFVPKLLLQPVIENAVLHAFEDRRLGQITLSADIAKDLFVITISDDGKGMDESTLELLRKHIQGTTDDNGEKKTGIALANVQKRIHMLFGAAYGISVYSTAGLVGAGRTELMRVIYGDNACEGGKIFLEDRELKIRNCSDAIRNGIGYIPEDRKTQGAFLRMSIKWNIAMNNLRHLSHGIFLNNAAEQESAEKYCKLFEIKTPGTGQQVMNLSGGNQQKVVIAKTIAASKKVIIFDEPTRGIDVKAKQEIYALMNNLVRDGNAIIMISSDMPELLGMSDRIAVIYEGRKNGEVMKTEFDQNYILDLASGGKAHEKAE